MKRKWQIALAALAGGAALWTAGCESDSLYEGVAIVPASVELRVGQSQTFRASGGQNYEWSFEPVDGRLGLNVSVGDAVVATGRMGDPDAFISQKDGKAYARPVVIGDSMQIDSIVSQRIQLARERKRQNKEQAGAVADAGRTDPWTDQVDASRGEYVGDGVPRTFNGEPFEPLSGYPTPGAAPAPADPAAPDFLSTPSDFTTGNAR